MQRQTARRREGLRAFIGHAAVNQRIRHQSLQVFRRLPLHAGRNFFAEEFKQEIGHVQIRNVGNQNFEPRFVMTGLVPAIHVLARGGRP